MATVTLNDEGEDIDLLPLPAVPRWPVLHPDALYGLGSELVEGLHFLEALGEVAVGSGEVAVAGGGEEGLDGLLGAGGGFLQEDDEDGAGDGGE